MIYLQNKNILFISVSFFSYEKAIAARLRDAGAEVDFYDDRPSNSNFSKGIIRFNKKIFQKQIDSYYQKILKRIQNKKYQYFLLIKGEAIPEFFFKELKILNPELEYIYYNFDSFSEYPNLVSHLKFFDKKFTFDKDDAIKYKIHFRPLFFLNEYQIAKNKTKNLNLDITFIGSAHTDRYIVGEKVSAEAEKLNLKTLFYYYAISRTVFRLKRFFDRNLKYFASKKISFQKLSHQQIIDYYQSSKTILDINKPFQKGLTIRTFETLAMGKKLITTNQNIKNYPFYCPENILVINRNEPKLFEDFFKTDFVDLEEKTLYMMSLDSFLECLFVENQDKYWL